MSAPLNTDPATGNWKSLAVILIVLFIVGGTLVYAATLPARRDPVKVAPDDTPQVQGEQTANGVDSEYVAPQDVKPTTAPATDIPQTIYKVTQTVDGDTVKVSIDDKTETIRLIGVDTPETKDPRKKVQCYGQAASDFTKHTLLNQDVRLQADDSQQNRDKYGRLLRYIFLTDGTNFNQKLIAEGYAYEYTYNVPYMYQAQFRDAQAAAADAQKGLWSPATCGGVR